jgi:hypothetical protein
MTNFKLIAIRPSKGCNRRFMKNLTSGQIYPLYNSYIFYDKDREPISTSRNEVVFFSENTRIPSGLYDRKTADGHSLKINISAIAGKNGSGKSSLIELLFASIYLLSVTKKLLIPNLDTVKIYPEAYDKGSEELTEIKTTIDQRQSSISKMLKDQNTVISFEQLKQQYAELSESEQQLKEKKEFYSAEKRQNRKREQEITKFGRQLKAQVFYELDNEVFCLSLGYDYKTNEVTCPVSRIQNIDENSDAIPDEVKIDYHTLTQNFFYTIAVNYSHYALNSNFLGEWINSLFHKNDGYTTPIVINPMRTDGNFDINSEIIFARYRLLTNVLQENSSSKSKDRKIYITENHFIKTVNFSLNWPKVDALPKVVRLRGKNNSKRLWAENLLSTLLADYLNKEEQIALYKVDFPLKDTILNYIVHKTDKIPEKYPWLGPGYQFSDSTPFVSNEAFFKKLKEDGSHITYKLKQAINFLKHNLRAGGKGEFSVRKGKIENKSKIEFQYTLEQLMDWMGNPNGAELIQFLPPSIFNIDFELSNDVKSKSFFNELSSGEQQLVHTVQSAIYHLNNLQSAHLGGNDRLKYEAINLVYDEIELYFHPEYQRRFVTYLLKAFERMFLNGQSHIKTINILLLTHSPFILSDIPSENIMLLELHERSKRSVPCVAASETFAANINDLLADSFFLKETLMGEFAETEIKHTINRIKTGVENEEDTKIIDLIGDSFLKANLQNFLKSKR